jgi:hypothetical protein
MTSRVLGAASNQPSAGQPSAGQASAGQQVTERPARFLSGWRMLVLCIVVLLAGVALAVQAGHDHRGVARAVAVLCVLCFVAGSLILRGLTAVVPGQAPVIQLIGKYRGTIRESGLHWVNPFTERIKGLDPDPQPGIGAGQGQRRRRQPERVSSLLVVLCREQATQPIVNTGALYQ